MASGNRKHIEVLAVGACLVLGWHLTGADPALAKKKVIERFEATAMDLDSARATIIDIGVFEWSTEEDRQALIEAFNEGGNDAVYKHLSKQPEMAYLRAPNTMGYQLRYAFQYEADGKRHIIFSADRPLAGFEVMRNTDSSKDNVSLVTLELDPATGKGTGAMIFGAKFEHNKKTGQLQIETISMNPTKFTKVETKEVKHKDKD